MRGVAARSCAVADRHSRAVRGRSCSCRKCDRSNARPAAPMLGDASRYRPIHGRRRGDTPRSHDLHDDRQLPGNEPRHATTVAARARRDLECTGRRAAGALRGAPSSAAPIATGDEPPNGAGHEAREHEVAERGRSPQTSGVRLRCRNDSARTRGSAKGHERMRTRSQPGSAAVADGRECRDRRQRAHPWWCSRMTMRFTPPTVRRPSAASASSRRWLAVRFVGPMTRRRRRRGHRGPASNRCHGLGGVSSTKSHRSPGIS